MPPPRQLGHRPGRDPGRLCRIAALASLTVLAACVQEGDFGRPAPGAWNGLIDATGSLAARARLEPSAPFSLTDDERTLRDRAWRYVMPAAGSDAFDDALANLTRSRLLPPNWRLEAVDSYHDGLIAESFRSPVSRYRRLSEDVGADGRLIPAFAAVAARVRDADALRLRSLPFVTTLDDDAVRDAAMRVAENRCLVAWVRLETGRRLARYRYALDRLVVEIPEAAEAVSAERGLGFLDGRRALLDALLPRDAEIRCGLAAAEGAQAALPLVRRN